MTTEHPSSVPARVLGLLAEPWRTLRAAVAHPGAERETALLLVKSAVATVLAWKFAVLVLHSTTPFYAPMAALLVVDRTMVRSISASAQRLLAVMVGMGVAWAVGSTAGLHWWSMGPVMIVALLIARWHRLGSHGAQVPTMVLLSLLTAGGTDSAFTRLTLVETLVGGVIGVATNAVLIAPLHVRRPREEITRLADEVHRLLRDMADSLHDGWDPAAAHEWHARGQGITALAPQVSEHVATGRESTRLNPVDNVQGLQVDWDGYEHAVDALGRAQWQATGIARTLVDAADDDLAPPSREFLAAYADVLDDLAAAIALFGRPADDERHELAARLDQANARLQRLSDRVRDTRLEHPGSWPAYGALLLDASRTVRVLSRGREGAAVPTESGPIRRPVLSRHRHR